MTVRERFNTLTSVELAAELKRIEEMCLGCSELCDDRYMAAYLDSEYGNNEYSGYEDWQIINAETVIHNRMTPTSK